MLFDHCTCHVSDRKVSHSVNFYQNRVNQERYPYISTMINTLVVLLVSYYPSAVRNRGVDHQYGTLERTPSIPMLYQLLGYFTL